VTADRQIILDRVASMIVGLRESADCLQKVIDTFPPDGDVDKLHEGFSTFCTTLEGLAALSRTHAPVRPEAMS
jgi:hypothetical protein